MAVIGKVLLNPESNWKRYDGNDNLFFTNSTVENLNAPSYYNGSYITLHNGDYVRFNMRGSKLRIIGTQWTGYSGNVEVYIDGKLVGNFSTNNQTNDVFQVLVFEFTNIAYGVHNVEIVNKDTSPFEFDCIDIDNDGQLLYKLYSENVLISHNNTKVKYNNSKWEKVNTTTLPTLQDFLNGNTPEEISQIPESAWQELSGEVELLYYTEDVSIEEVSFSIETEPFTLAGEFEGKDISIIEYTDNPIQEEAIVEIETELFDFYHEMGDSVEVLYYTDEDGATNADLEVTANYSPLDDIKEDFDIVTWSNESVNSSPLLTFNMNALPKGQLVVGGEDLVIHGDLRKLIIERLEEIGKNNGIVRMIVSFDSGVTYKNYKRGLWGNVLLTNEDVIARGSTLEEITSITEDVWTNAIDVYGSNIRFAFYIEENVRGYDSSIIKPIFSKQENATIFTPTINDTSLYILNTVSTINMTLKGRRIIGELSDEDSTKVQYRVFLNGNHYYPANGDFTPLANPTQVISLDIDHRRINMGVDNYLSVEFRDYWGQTDTWSTVFVGEPIGLLFKDPQNGYYANELGDVIKYLDIGTIIAGSVSIEHEVEFINKIGYHIKDAKIFTSTNESGVNIELSKTQSPFIASNEITFDGQIDEGESVSFYIRIKADSKATPRSGAEFQIKVYADIADGVVI